MAHSSTLPDALMAQFRTAIFERMSQGKFERKRPIPDWLRTLWPGIEDTTGPVDVGAHFLFLSSFLLDADPFWIGAVDLDQYPKNARGAAYLNSQAWTEEGAQGEEYLLEAVALRIPPSETSDMRAMLLVQPASISYAEHRRVLQEGRSLDLSLQHANQQLRRQRAALEGLIHDVEEPLTDLKDALLLLQHGSLTPSQQRMVTLAQQQVNVLQSTLQEAKPAKTPDKRTAPAEIPSLKRVVQEVVTRVENDTSPSSCSVALRTLPDASTPVPVESEQLRRVLTTLIEHGMRRSPADATVQVQVACTNEQATVHVIDSGPALSSAVRAHLFERNSHSTASPSEHDLTLYFARIAVESWGGQIGYTGTNTGPSIWFKVPIWNTGGRGG